MDDKLLALLMYVAYTWAKKKQEAQAEADKWREDLPVNGTDFQGNMWQRLAGSDLKNQRLVDQNLANATNADPGKVGQAQIGLTPAWNGNL